MEWVSGGITDLCVFPYKVFACWISASNVFKDSLNDFPWAIARSIIATTGVRVRVDLKMLLLGYPGRMNESWYPTNCGS